jgi:hypothetical protein
MTDQLIDRRDLPVFIHSDVDDLPLTPNAFRLYCHLARRAGNGTAWPSYQSMGDTCFKGLSDSADYRRRLALENMKELVKAGLVAKEERTDGAGRNLTNVYYLTPRSAWTIGVSNNTPPCATIREMGVSNNTLGVVSNNTLKGTPSEGSPIRDDDDDVTPGKVFKLFGDVMPGSLTPFIAESVDDLIKTYGCKEVYSAIEKAGKANARNLSYIEQILVNRAAGKDKPQKGGNNGSSKRSDRKVSSADAAYVMPKFG